VNKHEMREAAIERLRGHINHLGYYRSLIEAIVGDDYGELTVEECDERLIDLLTDDESYEDDAYTMGPRDADGIFWSRGDMSDSPWGVIEGVVYDCTRREWLVRGHDISAPWVPAGSIRHAPTRTATQRESDLIELLKDAAKDYQHEQSEVEWQKEMYRSMSDHVISDTMLLPRDADDEVVHIGDEMVVDGRDMFTVDGIGLLGDHGVVYYTTYDGRCDSHLASICHHYHKPTTVDEILDELEGMRGTGDYDDVVERCADLAGMLRELLKDGENEDQA